MAYIIYNKKMALYLREKGFKIINTAPNRNKPFFDVYFFEDNENLQKEIQNGKYIETSESLYGFLENYSS